MQVEYHNTMSMNYNYCMPIFIDSIILLYLTGQVIFEVSLQDRGSKSDESNRASIADTPLNSVSDERALLGKHTVINEQLISNVLRSRPTIRRGQARPKTAFPARNNPIYKSFQHRPSTTPGEGTKLTISLLSNTLYHIEYSLYI